MEVLEPQPRIFMAGVNQLWMVNWG
jgi:hypothetical protein